MKLSTIQIGLGSLNIILAITSLALGLYYLVAINAVLAGVNLFLANLNRKYGA